MFRAWRYQVESDGYFATVVFRTRTGVVLVSVIYWRFGAVERVVRQGLLCASMIASIRKFSSSDVPR